MIHQIYCVLYVRLSAKFRDGALYSCEPENFCIMCFRTHTHTRTANIERNTLEDNNYYCCRRQQILYVFSYSPSSPSIKWFSKYSCAQGSSKTPVIGVSLLIMCDLIYIYSQSTKYGCQQRGAKKIIMCEEAIISNKNQYNMVVLLYWSLLMVLRE